MKIINLLPILLAAPVAFAGPPEKTPKCSDTIQIRAPRGGAGVYFDADCSTAYVMPPAWGTLELSGISPSASRSDCRELEALEKTRAELAERLLRLAQHKPGQSSGGGSTIGGGGGLGGGGSQDNQAEPVDLEKIKKESEEIREQLTKLREAEKTFTQTEGLVGKIVYTLDHEGMVGEYARANPHFKNFVRLPVEVAYLSISAKGDKLKVEQSEVLDYTVPGLAKMPGEEGEGAPADSVYFGSAMSGKVRLTTRGACRFMNSSGKVPDRLSATMLEKHLSSNVTFGYGLNVHRKYKAQYNFKKLFEHISKQTKSGGFLSTKTVNEIVQRNEGGDWFTFVGETNDTRYSNDILVQNLKAEMIDNVMKNIAIGTVPGSEKIPGHLEPGPKGADVAASALKKCPYLYCQIGGYALDFISATFGSSKAVARFYSTIGYEKSEVVDEARTLRFIGTSTFKDRL
ncbi:MAG: hypothetical protein AB7F86_08125 [Bdellovibrionales bacterium]